MLHCLLSTKLAGQFQSIIGFHYHHHLSTQKFSTNLLSPGCFITPEGPTGWFDKFARASWFPPVWTRRYSTQSPPRSPAKGRLEIDRGSFVLWGNGCIENQTTESAVNGNGWWMHQQILRLFLDWQKLEMVVTANLTTQKNMDFHGRSAKRCQISAFQQPAVGFTTILFSGKEGLFDVPIYPQLFLDMTGHASIFVA